MFNVYFDLLTYSLTVYICLSDVKKSLKTIYVRSKHVGDLMAFYVNIYVYHFNIVHLLV